MIASLITHIGLPVLTGVLGDVLGAVNTPVTNAASKALKDVEQAIAQGKLSATELAEANRHAEKIIELKLQERNISVSEINKSLRAEIASQDQYVRRMRPTFGYVMALTWAVQMLGIAYVVVFDTPRSGVVLNAMGSLSAIWGVGLSVLGIYVYKRSEDKKVSGTAKETIYWN